ncbi:MAG: regulatory protein MerR [Nocardioides sp.]|nr:regulatory protein MerR [Nocardioides sp.]
MEIQNLRVYERRGLVDPDRTPGGSRLYSPDDIDRLHRIRELLADGLNLAGVARVVALEDRVGCRRSGSPAKLAMTRARPTLAGRPGSWRQAGSQSRSNRSSSMTWVQAATKSRTNFSRASPLA